MAAEGTVTLMGVMGDGGGGRSDAGRVPLLGPLRTVPRTLVHTSRTALVHSMCRFTMCGAPVSFKVCSADQCWVN